MPRVSSWLREASHMLGSNNPEDVRCVLSCQLKYLNGCAASRQWHSLGTPQRIAAITALVPPTLTVPSILPDKPRAILDVYEGRNMMETPPMMQWSNSSCPLPLHTFFHRALYCFADLRFMLIRLGDALSDDVFFWLVLLIQPDCLCKCVVDRCVRNVSHMPLLKKKCLIFTMLGRIARALPSNPKTVRMISTGLCKKICVPRIWGVPNIARRGGYIQLPPSDAGWM